MGLAASAMLALSATGAAPLAAAETRTQVLAIVVAHDSGVRDVSFYDLKRAFMGESTAVDGTRLVPLNSPPQSRERVAFDRVVLGMSQEEVARYWIDRKIRGQPGSPRAIAPVELLVKVVSKLDGTLTYVDPAHVVSGVKVVSVDGKLPHQAGYRLTY
jgi:hypothetical protein